MGTTGQIRAKAPGKLYIAGEYAVTDAGSPAILAAVDRYVTVTVGPASQAGHGTITAVRSVTAHDPAVHDDGRTASHLEWTRDGAGRPQAGQEPGFFDFAFSALCQADRYARTVWTGASRPTHPPLFDLRISSGLAAPDGTKYGLGSSAAVCVAVVRAVLAFWSSMVGQEDVSQAERSRDSRLLVFKLAAIAHLSIQGNGSLGDVAASSFGGWLLYHSFDRTWLRRRLAMVDGGTADGGMAGEERIDGDGGRRGTSFRDLIDSDWPALGLEPLDVDTSVRLIVGWSGRPASTQKLVARAARPMDPEDYRRFVIGSAECVAGLAGAMRRGDHDDIRAGIARDRGLLRGLARLRDVPIETDQLTAGVEAALGVGLAAKTSGAGLGDCLIALGDARMPIDEAGLSRLWRGKGITVLPVRIAPPRQSGHRPDQLAGAAAGPDRAADDSVDTGAPDPAVVSKRRKLAHLRLADLQNQERSRDEEGSPRLTQIRSGFAHVRLERPTLPQTRVAESDIGTVFLGHHVSAPFFIEAMTGGTPSATRLNEQLARVADLHGIAVAFGSASLVAKDPSALDGFVQARALTHGPVLANVNPSTPLPVVRRLVDALRPAALQVHVNAVQELVMGEGDRDFRWLDDLIRLRDGIDVPVIVKEVGFGWDVRSLRLLIDNGFDLVDIGGMGGTDFALIENARRRRGRRGTSFQAGKPDDARDGGDAGDGRTGMPDVVIPEDAAMDEDYSWLADCGVSTVRSLLNARQAGGSGGLRVIASGGVRTPLDVLKSLVLGAKAVGVAGRFLTPLLHGGEERLDRLISVWEDQLAGLYALYGITTTAQAPSIPYRIIDEDRLV